MFNRLFIMIKKDDPPFEVGRPIYTFIKILGSHQKIKKCYYYPVSRKFNNRCLIMTIKWYYKQLL